MAPNRNKHGRKEDQIGKIKKVPRLRPLRHSPFGLVYPIDNILTQYFEDRKPTQSLLHRPYSPIIMATTTDSSSKYVVFFDIDNTLYPASASISALMTEKIRGGFSIPLCEPTLTRTATSILYWYGDDTRGSRNTPYTLLPGIRTRHSWTYQTPQNRCITFPPNSTFVHHTEHMNLAWPIPRRPRFRCEM